MSQSSEWTTIIKSKSSLLSIDFRELWHIKRGCHYQKGHIFSEDKYTTKDSDRLFRHPMFYGLKEEEREYVCEKVFEFFGV